MNGSFNSIDNAWQTLFELSLPKKSAVSSSSVLIAIKTAKIINFFYIWFKPTKSAS